MKRFARGFVHNCVAHPFWWYCEALCTFAESLHDITAPEEHP